MPGTREILVPGRFGVEVERDLDEVRFTLWGRQWTPRIGRRYLLGSAVWAMAGVGVILGMVPMLLQADLRLAIAGPLLLAGLAVAVGPTAAAAVADRRPSRQTLRITGGGIAVGDGPVRALGPATEVLFIVHERGAAARTSTEVVEALAVAAAAPQPPGGGQVTSLCGVDLVIDGEVVPVARKLEPAAALALHRALVEHLPTEPSALADSEGLEELQRMRQGAASKAQKTLG